MDCQKCKKVLSKKGAHFVCQGPCEGTFHRNCVKGLAADMKAGKTRIYCNNCEDEGSDEGEQEEEVRDFEKILKDIQKKVSTIPSLKKHLDTIQQSISVLSDKYDTLLAEHEEAKTKIHKLEKSVVSINNKCVYLEKCNLALEQRMHDMDQSTRKYNIEVAGVEYLPGENVKDIVSKIGQQINASCEPIEWVKRNRPAKIGTKPPSIIIGFKTTCNDARDNWLSNRHKLNEASNSTFTGGTSNSKIYINEDLTKSTKILLWNAKKQLRGVYKFIWVTNGKILVKKGEGDRAIWLRSESEINNLLKTK